MWEVHVYQELMNHVYNQNYEFENYEFENYLILPKCLNFFCFGQVISLKAKETSSHVYEAFAQIATA